MPNTPPLEGAGARAGGRGGEARESPERFLNGGRGTDGTAGRGAVGGGAAGAGIEARRRTPLLGLRKGILDSAFMFVVKAGGEGARAQRQKKRK